MINKYNFNIFGFLVSALFFGAGIFLKMTNKGEASVLNDVLIPTSIAGFLFSVWASIIKKPKSFNSRRKIAVRNAKLIYKTIMEHISWEEADGPIRVFDLIQKHKSMGLVEEDLYKMLLDLVPASFLPTNFDKNGPTLDWYKYDLCIVAAGRDLRMANRIKLKLSRIYPNLRVFPDGELSIGRQEKLIERVYYAASHLCLALISDELRKDPGAREKLNVATTRETHLLTYGRFVSPSSAVYLKPIPLDEPGREYMAKDKILAPFVEYSPSKLPDRHRLYINMIRSLSIQLGEILPGDHSRSLPPSENRLFISHSHKDDEFARPLYYDLDARGIGCWFAPLDMKIGENIWTSIASALKNQEKVLLVLSESSIKSPSVKREVELAFEMEREYGKTLLFPIKIGNAINGADAEWVNLILQQRNIGDFTDWKNPEAYEWCLRRLIQALRSESL
jgi:hypothetical protein